MASEELLRRENAELRAREERYREGLQRQLDLSKRLREYAAHLRAALRSQTLRSTESVFAEVAEVSAEALRVGRVSVWLFDAERHVLECHHLYVHGYGQRVTSEIPISDVQGYVRALTTDLLAVEDVATDPRLLELRRYCAERGIGALLDVPIVVDGEILGVICHEHVGGERSWHDAEIDFAANLGSVVALAIEAERRHRAQDLAREVDARYRHLVETLPVAIYSIDAASGKLVYASPRIEAITGRSAAHWLAGGIAAWIESVDDEDRGEMRERMRPPSLGALDPELVYRLRRPDGALVWIRDLRTVVRDASGRPLAIQGTLEDITAERAADQRRLEIERRYRALIDHVDLIGVALDAQGRITAVNEAFVRTAGVPREAAIGATYVDRFVPEYDRARVRATLEDGVRTRALPPRCESTLMSSHGEPRSIVWTLTLMYDDAREVVGIATLGLDLTERLQLEGELAQQRKFESLGRMAASVAHDFNNVLTVISLSLAAYGTNGKTKEIESAMTYASGLVSSLLSYARRDPVAVAEVDVDVEIQELAPVLATAIGHEVRLEVDLHSVGRRVQIAPTELRQLVVNLVTNAGEATRGFGEVVRVTTAVVARESPPAACLELVIADDGRGMDEATRARAFDPFFTTKPRGEGTGIGLATCQSIVTRANGSITVDSRPGHGTRFRILLPLAQASGEAAAPHAPGDEPVEPARVLLVEDSPTIGGLITIALREAGYDVTHVKRAADAREAIAAHRFGVVITDLQLPDGRGEELAAAARARSDRTAIVIASGEAAEPGAADAVVMKPFTAEELVAGIERAVAARSPA